MTDSEWGGLTRDLTRKYGEDAAQEALTSFVAEVSAGVEIRDPTGWCRVAAKHWLQRKQTRDSWYTQLKVPTSEDQVVPEQFIDNVTPERVVAAKQQLARASTQLLDLTLFREEEEVNTQRQVLRPVPLSPEEWQIRAKERKALQEETL